MTEVDRIRMTGLKFDAKQAVSFWHLHERDMLAALRGEKKT